MIFTPTHKTFALKRTTEYTLSGVEACDEDSFVYAYAVGYCGDTDSVGGCNFGKRRKIRAFSDQTMGVQEVRAVDVHDLDNWVL